MTNFKVVEHSNLLYKNKPDFEPFTVAVFNRRWKAQLYIWWNVMWWEPICKFCSRWEIEEENTIATVGISGGEWMQDIK